MLCDSPSTILTPCWCVTTHSLCGVKRNWLHSKLVCSFQGLASSPQATSQQLHQSRLLHRGRGFSGAQGGRCASRSTQTPSGGLVWKRGPAAPKNLRTPRTSLSEVGLHGDRDPSRFDPVSSDQWPSFPPRQLLLSAFPNPVPIPHTSACAVSWADLTTQRPTYR